MRKKGKDEDEDLKGKGGSRGTSAGRPRPTSRPTPPARGSSRGTSRDRIAPAKDRPRIRVTHGTPGLGSPEAGARPRPTRGAGPSGATPFAGRGTARPTLDRARPFAGRAPAAPKKPLRPAHDEAAPEEERRAPVAPAKRRSVAPPEPSSAAKELALAIASAGLDKKALGIEVLDVTGRVDYADFLVIMTGSSDRHVHAIASGIEEALSKKKLHPLSVEGLGAGTWVLIDFDDVVVHVFQEESRRVYDIEGLWMDARRIEIAEPQRPRS